MNTKTICLSLLLTASLSAVAAETVNLGSLETLQQQTLILSQQAKQAELQKKIAGAQSTDNTPGRRPAIPSASGIPFSTAPVLSGILGTKGKLTARVRYNGVTLSLDQGQNWPGSSVTISAITPDGVRLSNGTTLNPGESREQRP